MNTNNSNWVDQNHCSVSVRSRRDHTSGDSFIMTAGPDIYLIGGSIEDQDFIVHARQDLPMLLSEVQRLRTILASESGG